MSQVEFKVLQHVIMSLYEMNQTLFNITHRPVLLWARVSNVYSFLSWDTKIKSSRGKRMSGLNLQCSVRLRCFISETWQESIDFPRSKQASANSLRQLMALFFSISQGLVYWLCTALTMVKHCIKAKTQEWSRALAWAPDMHMCLDWLKRMR